MAMLFDKMGISYYDVIDAISDVKSGKLGKNNSASKTTYILCPEKNELWDLKPVVGLLLERAGSPLKKEDWVTTKFQNDLLNLGFAILKFDDILGRKLGMKGCDLSELSAPHTIFFPNRSSLRNGLSLEESECILPDGKKITVISCQHVRNSAFVKETLLNANGTCGSCGQRGFRAKNGSRFLEVHHKTWLSENGPDIPENMVALCPNCHRQEHHGIKRVYPKRNWI